MKNILCFRGRATVDHKAGSRGRWWVGVMDNVPLVATLVSALLFAGTTLAFGQATESKMRAAYTLP